MNSFWSFNEFKFQGKARQRPGTYHIYKQSYPLNIRLLALTTAWIIDGIFVGRYVGPQGIAAINLSYPILSFSFGISVMIAMGGSTLASASKGAEKENEGNRYFSATVILVSVLSAVFTISGLIFKIPLISLLGADEYISSYVSEYITVIFFYILPLVITYTLDAFIRNSGAPGFSVATLTAGAVLNIILDWLFVGRMGFGLTGAAHATGLSQLAVAAAQLFFFFQKIDVQIYFPLSSFEISYSDHL